MKTTDRLHKMNACGDAVMWVGKRGLKTGWRDCPRGDWMLWLAARLKVDRKLLVLAACDCAETALQYVPKGEDRPAEAIRIARAWCADQAWMGDVRKAADAAYAAAVYDAADAAANAAAVYDAAAAYAAAAAVYAAAVYAAAGDAAYAADAAANAAYAAYGGMSGASKDAHQVCVWTSCENASLTT